MRGKTEVKDREGRQRENMYRGTDREDSERLRGVLVNG